MSGLIPRFSLLSSKRPYLAIHLDRNHGRKNDWAPMILRMHSCHYISRRYGRSVIMWDYGGWHPTTLPTSSHSNLTLFALSLPPPPPPLDAPARSTTSHTSACILPDGHQSTRLLEKSGSFGDLQVLLASLPHPPLTPPNTQRTTYTHDTKSRTHTQMKTHVHTCGKARFHSHTHTHARARMRTRAATHTRTRVYSLLRPTSTHTHIRARISARARAHTHIRPSARAHEHNTRVHSHTWTGTGTRTRTCRRTHAQEHAHTPCTHTQTHMRACAM